MHPVERQLRDLAVPGADGAGLDFRLPGDFIGFAGHFPGRPVLPAVVQLVMGRLTCEAAMDQFLEIVAVRRAKFTSPALPGEDLSVRLTADIGLDLTADVRILRGDTSVSAFRLSLCPRRENT